MKPSEIRIELLSEIIETVAGCDGFPLCQADHRKDFDKFYDHSMLVAVDRNDPATFTAFMKLYVGKLGKRCCSSCPKALEV